MELDGAGKDRLVGPLGDDLDGLRNGRTRHEDRQDRQENQGKTDGVAFHPMAHLWQGTSTVPRRQPLFYVNSSTRRVRKIPSFRIKAPYPLV